jgi:hypothetical protein
VDVNRHHIVLWEGGKSAIGAGFAPPLADTTRHVDVDLNDTGFDADSDSDPDPDVFRKSF